MAPIDPDTAQAVNDFNASTEHPLDAATALLRSFEAQIRNLPDEAAIPIPIAMGMKLDYAAAHATLGLGQEVRAIREAIVAPDPVASEPAGTGLASETVLAELWTHVANAPGGSTADADVVLDLIRAATQARAEHPVDPDPEPTS